MSRESQDHPRIRGEHDVFSRDTDCPHGSSPHTRGARCSSSGRDECVRIIPAYAGSTPSPPRRRPYRRDHPRIRGEHPSLNATVEACVGSSPHTRGAPERESCVIPRVRIIPAYAGSTHRLAPIWSSSPDHPRIRGEHSFGQIPTFQLRGSSPHTRGARDAELAQAEPVGIIPAYAGSTTEDSRRAGGQADHPRIRGEHGQRAVPDVGGAGSSPHTRGAHSMAKCRDLTRRIIPAYAGSTCRCR